jgi:small subunit ribosomal protein S4
MSTKFTENTQCKRCRRAAEKLFLKGEKCNSAKCPMIKRNFVPGMHGPTQRVGKKTNYGKQLMEKQKAKRMYGLQEVQFRNYFEKALSKVGNTGELLFRFLESRLDNVVYRLGYAPSQAPSYDKWLVMDMFELMAKKSISLLIKLKLEKLYL